MMSVRLMLFTMSVMLGCALRAVQAETIALWLFDDPVGSSVAVDSSGNGYDLMLGSDAAIHPAGKFGNALDADATEHDGLGDFRYKGRLLFIAVLSPCAACIILSQTSMLWTTIFAAGLFGALSSQYGPASQSAIMKATPEEFRGRVASLVSLAFGLGSVGVMMHGLVAQVAGVQMGYLVFGTLALVLNVTYFATLRTYRQMS